MANTNYLSDGTTTFSNMSLSGTLAAGAVSLVSEGAGTAVTASTSVLNGQLWVTVGASGLSVGIESGGSLYWINSTTSAT